MPDGHRGRETVEVRLETGTKIHFFCQVNTTEELQGIGGEGQDIYQTKVESFIVDC